MYILTDVSSPKHTYISDLDDLSDLTPLPSDVDQDTRPSTPDHVIHNSEASSSAPHCRPYASPVKKRKLNGGNNYFPISSKHAQSPSLKGKQSVPDPDSDSELPAYYAVWSSQQTAPPSQDDAETISRQPERKAKSKGKRKKRSSVASEKEPAQEDDEFERSLLQIPGELIYAKAMPKGEYWPALIEEYIKDGEDKGQYRIIWMDDSKQNIPRSWFYTSQDEEFITCKVRIGFVALSKSLTELLASLASSRAYMKRTMTKVMTSHSNSNDLPVLNLVTLLRARRISVNFLFDINSYTPRGC